jgi:hypothetical protein
MYTFQGKEGLERPDMVRYFCSISEAASPRVTARNYVLLTEGKAKELQGILDRINGPSLIYNGLIGKFGLLIYAKDGKQGELFPEYVPVCRNFLENFESQHHFSGAMLVCVRKNGEQHIYFYVGGTGLFYNTEDSSLDFLKQEYSMLASSLWGIPQAFGIKNNK